MKNKIIFYPRKITLCFTKIEDFIHFRYKLLQCDKSLLRQFKNLSIIQLLFIFDTKSLNIFAAFLTKF